LNRDEETYPCVYEEIAPGEKKKRVSAKQIRELEHKLG
jgi:hypothetical protein